MKISVVIIAHNEEKHIGRCIASILAQTAKAYEIVLVVHNSTDRTFELAKAYEDNRIKIIHFDGPPGIVYARLKGIQSAIGTIILCIDGDSFARKNWILVMSQILIHEENILAGSWVRLRSTLFGCIANYFNKKRCVSINAAAAVWLRGQSFGFWKHDKKMISETLSKSIILSELLQLSRNPDNYWLALMVFKMMKNKHKGKNIIQVTNKTCVTHCARETSTRQLFFRNKENLKNEEIIRFYMKTHP